MSKRTASFSLNTCSASSKNALKTNITWTGISLREILKDEYDKYDRFKLILSEVAYATNSMTISQTPLMLNFTGLPFEKSTYIIGTNNALTNYTALCPICITQAGGTLQFYDYVGVVFTKQEVFNLNIFAVKITDNTTPTQTLPEMSFLFHIVGVDI